MNLVAKPIVNNKLWIVTSDSGKVGNVEYKNNVYNLRIGSKESIHESTKSIQKIVPIAFERTKYKSKIERPSYAIWPTPGRTYNNLFDVKRKLHIFTKTKKSKCFYVAGWFKIMMNETWTDVFCPKYIFIQRYQYVGPFLNKDHLHET